MSKKFEPKPRIKVENLVPWEVGFPCYTIRGKEQGLIISGSQIHGQLTYEEIEEQINSENVAFCGVDGKGTHACLRICDFEAHKALFQEPNITDYPIQLTKKAIDELLMITDIKEFNKRLDELVITSSEKKAFAHYISNHPSFNDLSFAFIKSIEAKTGMNFLN